MSRDAPSLGDAAESSKGSGPSFSFDTSKATDQTPRMMRRVLSAKAFVARPGRELKVRFSSSASTTTTTEEEERLAKMALNDQRLTERVTAVLKVILQKLSMTRFVVSG